MAELVTLRAFLKAYEREPWTPGGKVDCCLIIAEWIRWQGFPDPAAHLRGVYQPGQGQLDMLAANGGAVGLISACVEPLGAVPVDEPCCGDFGALGSRNNLTRQFGAIHDGQGWLTRAPDGFKRIIARPLAIWRL